MSTLMDWARALQNADGSEELLLELAEVFIAECPEMMRQLRAAIDGRDMRELQRTAHSLKGSARIFAAPAATDAAFRLEAMGADGDLRHADDAWAILRFEIDGLVRALTAKVQGQGSNEASNAHNS
ncbi:MULTISPECIES: Hpt domain-containing protein [Sphingobium]|uniref:HPt domain-containing protein n=1 Tax=Sphingobium chungbukense TaxID=56193 RepID=A0A0M3ANN6_9SPHN|nr:MULTISPECIES: Hpt domain-containing protein [Sphingobium]KKW91757.1 hypothetical protein YP76_11550 [Sphingobium chungbukense]PJG45939.1 Hpt domain-containing protein [Sphingobium sp. LB126]